MKPKSMNTPSEMVISAVHFLGEKNGSSPQDIVRFISGKHKIDSNELKPQVQAALKRCMTFGLLSQESGLYRLKETKEIPAQMVPIVSSKRKRVQKVSKKRKVSKRKPKRSKKRSRKSSKKIAVRRVVTAAVIKRKNLKTGERSSKIGKSRKKIQKKTVSVRESAGESSNSLVGKNLENIAEEDGVNLDENSKK